MDVIRETSPSTAVREPQACPGRCQAQVWLRKTPHDASSVSEEAGKELQAIGDKKASYHVEAPVFLRIVPILGQTR